MAALYLLSNSQVQFWLFDLLDSFERGGKCAGTQCTATGCTMNYREKNFIPLKVPKISSHQNYSLIISLSGIIHYLTNGLDCVIKIMLKNCNILNKVQKKKNQISPYLSTPFPASVNSNAYMCLDLLTHFTESLRGYTHLENIHKYTAHTHTQTVHNHLVSQCFVQVGTISLETARLQ